MLSIVIPEYNYVCTELVQALAMQCQGIESLRYEILVVDDGSRDDIRQANAAINQLPGVRLLLLAQNGGRSAALNAGIQAAQGEWFLVIDSDAKVCRPDFIQTYLDEAAAHPGSVICGSLQMNASLLREDNTLRYRYEAAASRSHRQAAEKQAHPYERFYTFNVLVPKTVFDAVRFDDRLVRYGYEDVLFGLELERRRIPVRHVDNPLVHTGIDDNTRFLSHTEDALRNLCTHAKLFQDRTQLIRFYQKMRRWHLVPFIRLWHRLFGPLERRNLLGRHPNLTIFTLYKLGFYATLRNQNPNRH